MLCEMASLSVFMVMLGVASGSLPTTQQKKEILQVVGVDFRNTIVNQVCLIANMSFTVTITKLSKSKSYDLTTNDALSHEGSTCDNNYSSSLILNYGHSIINMTFTKQRSTSKIKEEEYCKDCNTATWRLVSITMEIRSLSKLTNGEFAYQYYVKLEAESNALQSSMGEMTEFGIDIDRAFKCEKSNEMHSIPMNEVKNLSSNFTPYENSELKIEMKFSSIAVQPFLVSNSGNSLVFSDPYLCGDLMLPHALVITLPILYFIILLLFYKLRKTHGCHIRKVYEPKVEEFVAEKVPLETHESHLLTVNYQPMSSTSGETSTTKETSAV